jgi:predicted ABC-type transport system involved in lysophospholipase L1 biosynthesis ATPase subunit
VNIPLAKPLGFVELDEVWLDDRARCVWALCGVTLVIEPGQTVALVSPRDEGAPDAVLDLIGGWRLATRGCVSIDGVALADLDRLLHLRSLAQEFVLDTGERRLSLAGRTTLVARPTEQTLATADEVIEFTGGRRLASSPAVL